jgi:hypothetical protein
MGTGCGQGNGSANGNGASGNLAFTKFLFLIARADDDAHGMRLRTAGANLSRASSTISTSTTRVKCRRRALKRSSSTFAMAKGPIPIHARARASRRHVTSSRCRASTGRGYRSSTKSFAAHWRFRGAPRVRRRLSQSALLERGDGAVLELGRAGAAFGTISARRDYRADPQDSRVVAEERARTPLVFLSHVESAERDTGERARAGGREGDRIAVPRVYHNPDGYERPGEFDFVTYFECDDESLPVFDQVLNSLRDPHQNPEWRYVEEGPILARQTGPSLVAGSVNDFLQVFPQDVPPEVAAEIPPDRVNVVPVVLRVVILD